MWRDLLVITDIEFKEKNNNATTKGAMGISNDNSLFKYTCKSFDVICQLLQLNVIDNINDFNEKCNFISNYLLERMFDISPLFILSLRREYFMMIINETKYNNDDASDICHHILIHDIFKVLHENNNFHQVPYPILFHTHISKCLGTTFFRGLEQIASNYNKTNKIRRDLYFNTQTFVFKGVTALNSKPYSSCEWLYNYHINNYTIIPARVESESPLAQLCPQYYNSIILRNPIQHRLSFLAYINQFEKGQAGIYCKHKLHNTLWKLCRETHEMNGFIFELFGAINQSKTLQILENQKLIIEYLNQLVQNRSIGYRNLRIINKEIQRKKSGLSPLFYRFDVKQLIGWMSNIYNRWIGYNYSNYTNNNGNNLLNGINANVYDIIDSEKQILFNSKRILLQYDYVLPIDDSKNLSTESDIWIHTTRHIWKHILNITGNEYTYTNAWSHKRTQSKLHGIYITTSTLLDYFNKTEELNLLIQYNMLDIYLFEFSKVIAKADLYFFLTSNKSD